MSNKNLHIFNVRIRHFKTSIRIRLPVLSQLSTNLKNKLAVLPAAGSLETEKAELYLKNAEVVTLFLSAPIVFAVVFISVGLSGTVHNAYSALTAVVDRERVARHYR